MRLGLRALFLGSFGLVPLILTGCSLSPSPGATPTPDKGIAIQGRVFGGQQRITGAHVYLLEAVTGGNAGLGWATSGFTASTPLLSSTGSNTTLDTSGGATNGFYYVTSDSNGAFSITGDYTCTPNQQVYLYALGGNPGLTAGTNNTAAGLLAALGNCPSATSAFPSTLYVVVNEVSTIATAYAIAGFAGDALHVSTSGSTLAQLDIQNAFANAANLETLGTGVALATTPALNGTVPQAEINTLANILAACVNTSGPMSGGCTTLLATAKSAGASGNNPFDTATAAINIAHNPGANIAALYALSIAAPPFAPALSAQPKDFTIALNFSGGGLVGGPVSIAIDGAGDVWTANEGGWSVTELSSLGAPFLNSPYTGGSLDFPQAIAINGLGDAWVSNNGSTGLVNDYNGSVTELSSSGIEFSSSPYVGGGLSVPYGVAIDGSGNAWVSDQVGPAEVSEFNSAGIEQSGAGYTGGGLTTPYGIAIDGSGAAWAVSYTTVSKFTSTGTVFGYTDDGINGAFAIALDGSGYAWVTNAVGNSISKFSNSVSSILLDNNYIGGGLNEPFGIAIDGAGSVWVANSQGNSISEFSSSGLPISPSTGYGVGASLTRPSGIAIDGSGDVWVTNGNGVAELIGAAAPVITPICAGLPATPTGNGTSSLGTRP